MIWRNQLAFLSITALILLSGCIKTGAGETHYVCPDGHTVSDPQNCPPPEPEKEEEKTSGVIVKYICPDGGITLSQSECKIPKPQTETIIKYVCPDGSIVEEKDSCKLDPKQTDCSCTSTTTTMAKTTTSTTTTSLSRKSSVKEKEDSDDEEESGGEEDSDDEREDEGSCAALGCPQDTEYVGSKNSEKYHTCGCRWAGRIKPENIVCFKSKKEAEDSGRIPCNTCKIN